MLEDCNVMEGSQTRSIIDVVGKTLATIESIEIPYFKDYSPRDTPGVSPETLPLEAEMKCYLARVFPNGLFTHQHKAISMVLGGANAVITTSTASGKSLVFAVPTFDAFLTDDGATSLFLYPQKALANDQMKKLKDMCCNLCPNSRPEDLIARYDGATPQASRAKIRENAHFILTNPDMLHYALLQYHDKWKRFFRGLRHVVIDEAHSYGGIFGSSVAYIIRRLRCICHQYGSDPVFISASATIRSPSEHMQRLTGVPFSEIGSEDDGSTQAKKRIWLVRGKLPYYQLGRILTQRLVDKGLNCLSFCPSRISAERLVADLTTVHSSDTRIRVYRAGLRAREREEIEAGMKKGDIKGVFSTSALELGIDIGTLDVVLCIGLPNTMMSLWQRAGRVGRRGKEGAVVFIAANTPLDTYYCEHPAELFERTNEPLILNLQNHRLICHHLACGIQEAGDEESLQMSVLGPYIERVLDLRKKGQLSHEVFYSDEPHMRTPIRCADTQNYRLILHGDEIGEIDSWHLIREAYPHAIYLHGGHRYRVIDVLKSNREIRLRRERSLNITNAHLTKAVYARRVRAVTKYARLLIKKCDFDVSERLVQVVESNPSGEVVCQYQGSAGIAPHMLPTEGISIEVLPQLCSAFSDVVTGDSLSPVVHAIERLIRGLFPVISGPCDMMDYDTFSQVRPGKICWYLYDRVHDGIDLTVQAYPRVRDLLEKALDRLISCDCTDDEGCFRCIRNPDEDQPVSKEGCLTILRLISQELRGEYAEEEFACDLLVEGRASQVCHVCGKEVDQHARFCSNCGERLEAMAL